MKLLMKSALIAFSVMLALFLADRFLVNPRPLTTVGTFTLLVLLGATAFCAATVLALRTRFAAAAKNAWLVLLSSMVAYLVVDVVAGAVLIGALSPAIVRDDYSHHRLDPDKTSTIETYDFVYTQRVNELGLRGGRIAAEKEPGTYRVLMLGDSFTMGYGVADDETFSALLEESLNRRAPGGAGPRIEVLNGGVDSYAPVLSRLQLERLGPLLAPDLIVLNLDMSDLIQEQAYRALAVRDQAGEIVAVRAPEEEPGPRNWGGALARFINNHLIITRLIMFSLRERDDQAFTVANTVINPDYELLRHTLADDATDRSEQWEDMFDSILAIKRYADERGIGFLLTTYPWGHQVHDSEWQQGRVRFVRPGSVVSDASVERIARFAKAHGVKFIDMFPAFRARAGTERLYYTFDMHWTPAGHRLAAAQLEPAIEEAVPWSRPRSAR